MLREDCIAERTGKSLSLKGTDQLLESKLIAEDYSSAGASRWGQIPRRLNWIQDGSNLVSWGKRQL